MKRLNGRRALLIDWLDIVLISFEVGAVIAFLYRRYQKNKNLDPIVAELKKNSLTVEKSNPSRRISTKRFSKKLHLIRGGELTKNGAEISSGVSLVIRNKKFSAFLKALVEAKRSQKLLILLQIFFAILNHSLEYNLGLRIYVSGSLNFTQIILLAVSGSVSGILVGQILNPLATMALPLMIMFGRGIEDVPDPQEKCKLICEIAENYHNKQHLVQMQELNSLVAESSEKLKLPLEKVPLMSVECVKEKVSILQRYKLRQVVESEKVKNRVKYFNKFIEKFPECDVNIEEIAKEVGEKMKE
jgi:hypothetical protein